MIRYKTGNILKENIEAIVNTVNCVGVMGRGIALQFKKTFPENFKSYLVACKRGEVQPGRMFICEINQTTNPRYIVNFPTKRHWRAKSNMCDIQTGLEALIKEIQDRNITSIAIPPLGSGLGGLNWEEVRSQIEKAFQKLNNVDVVVFEPKVIKTEAEFAKSTVIPKMTSGRAALICLIHRYLAGLMDPFVSLLEIHKLMYFMQEAGEPLRLQFKKASYGPYAENLRHVLNAIEGHLILGYADGGDRPDKKIELVEGALEAAEDFLKTDLGSTRKNIEKVAKLVDGFETPFGLELLATVHWVTKNENASSINSIIEKTYSWNNRKKQFSKRQIEIAYDSLKRWFNEEGILQETL